MNRTSRIYAPLKGLPILLTIALAAGACGEDPASDPTPGHCVPFEPMPGYTTCLMSESQGEATDSASSPLQHELGAGGGASFVSHRKDYLTACAAVHNQHQCGWCTLHATTAYLEAQVCQKISKESPDAQFLASIPSTVSVPHLAERAGWDGDGCDTGFFIPDAFAALDNDAENERALVHDSIWPFNDLADPKASVTRMLKARPSDAKLAEAMEFGVHGISRVRGPELVRQALQEGADVVYDMAVFNGAGWSMEDVFPAKIHSLEKIPRNGDDKPFCYCPGLGENTSPVCDHAEQNCLLGYHSVLITGFQDSDPDFGGKGSFEIQNSWGWEWGDAGYGKISFEAIRQGGRGGWFSPEVVIYPFRIHGGIEGPKEFLIDEFQPIAIPWKGRPVFPVFVEMTNTECAPNDDWNCDPASISIESYQNPVVLPEWGCESNGAQVTQAETFSYDLVLRDALGQATAPVSFTFTCSP